MTAPPTPLSERLRALAAHIAPHGERGCYMPPATAAELHDALARAQLDAAALEGIARERDELLAIAADLDAHAGPVAVRYAGPTTIDLPDNVVPLRLPPRLVNTPAGAR